MSMNASAFTCGFSLCNESFNENSNRVRSSISLRENPFMGFSNQDARNPTLWDSEPVVYSIVNNYVTCDKGLVEVTSKSSKSSSEEELNISKRNCKGVRIKKITELQLDRRRSSVAAITPTHIEQIKNDIQAFESDLKECVINTCFSKVVPIKIKTFKNIVGEGVPGTTGDKELDWVKLETIYNNTFIKVIDVVEHDLNHNLLYPISYLLDLKSIESDPLVKSFSHDIIFNVYNYLQFLEVNNVTMGYRHLIVLANVPDMDNAYWNGRYLTFGSGTKLHTPLTSSAIVGHELTHALIQTVCDLEYQGHSGALNESYADIFGVCYEFYIKEKYQKTLGWEIGKECNFLMRNMKSPHECQQPERMYDLYYFNPNENIDNGGVHTNSGIINHVFFKLQERIGYKKAFNMFVLILYQLLNNSNFHHFRSIFLKVGTRFCNLDVLVDIMNSHIF